jgi:hypothetical protein
MFAAAGSSDSSGKPERSSAARNVTVISSVAVRHPRQEDMASGPVANSAVRVDPREDSRFRIFVIDTGQHPVASKVLRENFALLQDVNRNDPAYYLDRDKSADLLCQHTRLIGRDPIIMVQDMRASHQRNADRAHGFRVHLGLLRKEQDVLPALQMFARFIRSQRAAKNLGIEAREKLIAEGFPAPIEIVGGNR